LRAGLAVEWLKLNPPNEPISLDAVKVLAKHGSGPRDEKGRFVQGDNVTLEERGTARAYLLAQLEGR
jgi:hypothetical protein